MRFQFCDDCSLKRLLLQVTKDNHRYDLERKRALKSDS
jgi:hypothetical protein